MAENDWTVCRTKDSHSEMLRRAILQNASDWYEDFISVNLLNSRINDV